MTTSVPGVLTAAPTSTIFPAHSPIFPVNMDHCEFRKSPVHGWGVFATEDIEPGILIIREEPLWMISKEFAVKGTFSTSTDHAEARLQMSKAFVEYKPRAESNYERDIYKYDLLNLCGGFTEDERVKEVKFEGCLNLAVRLRDILIRNAVAERSEEQSEWAAVFRGSSRLNHSCRPNAERMVHTMIHEQSAVSRHNSESFSN